MTSGFSKHAVNVLIKVVVKKYKNEEFLEFMNMSMAKILRQTGCLSYDLYKDLDEENVSVSGIQYRYSSQVPILISAEYSFRPDATLKPYANFALGTMYSRRDTDMGM